MVVTTATLSHMILVAILRYADDRAAFGEALVVVRGREDRDAALSVGTSGGGADACGGGARDRHVHLVAYRIGRDRMDVAFAGGIGRNAGVFGQAFGIDDAEELAANGRRARQEVVAVAWIVPDFVSAGLIVEGSEHFAISLINDDCLSIA